MTQSKRPCIYSKETPISAYDFTDLLKLVRTGEIKDPSILSFDKQKIMMATYIHHQVDRMSTAFIRLHGNHLEKAISEIELEGLDAASKIRYDLCVYSIAMPLLYEDIMLKRNPEFTLKASRSCLNDIFEMVAMQFERRRASEASQISILRFIKENNAEISILPEDLIQSNTSLECDACYEGFKEHLTVSLFGRINKLCNRPTDFNRKP